ncbi:MAG: YihY/virulence factor BrkB family protein [Oligoflexales bacterium]
MHSGTTIDDKRVKAESRNDNTVKLKEIWLLCRDTLKEFSADKVSRLGAALAYYSVFSLGPLLILLIAIAGMIFGEEAVRGQVFEQLQGLIGEEGASAIQTMVIQSDKPRAGILSAMVGGITLVLGATGVIVQLKDALNTIWEVKPKPDAGIRYFLKTYVISLAAILGIGFLLIISLVASAVIAAMGSFATSWLPLPEMALHALNFVISLAFMSGLFSFLFKFLPDVRIPWPAVWPGALVTAILFTLGKLLIGLYLGKAAIETTYGAAGSIIVVLVWIYYSSQIFLLGAEFTEVYARVRKFKTTPKDDVVSL